VVTPEEGRGSSGSGATVGRGVADGVAVGVTVGVAVDVAAGAVVGVGRMEVAIGAGTVSVGVGDGTATLDEIIGVGESVAVGTTVGVGPAGFDITVGCGVDTVVGAGGAVGASTMSTDGVTVGSVAPVHATKIVARTAALAIANRALIVWFTEDKNVATVRVSGEDLSAPIRASADRVPQRTF